MKIRNGFVSNSSTSSFCIYGAYLSDFKGGVKEVLRDCAKKIDKNVDDYKQWDLYELLEGILDKSGLEFYMPYDGDSVCVGRSWASIKDNETGLQFKQSVKEKVKEVFGESADKLSFSSLEEAWRDG